MDEDRTIRVGHLIPYLGRSQGGPVLNLSECAKAQLEQGLQVSIFSTTRASDGAPAPVDSRATLVTGASPGWGPLRKCPLLWKCARSAIFDIVHSHGLWTDVNRLAAEMARRRKIPHVLTPCGMLAQGALRHHWWNKVPAKIWFQGRGLREAACFQAQSEIEVQQIRSFGLRNPVALIPASVPGRPLGFEGRRAGGGGRRAEGRGQKSEVRSQGAEVGGQKAVGSNQWSVISDQGPVVPGRRTVLFLGRLHPVKGVGRLVEAWMKIEKQKAESRKQKSALGPLTSDLWSLIIAGPDEAGMRPGLEAALRARGCAESVIFTGQLDEQQKWAAFKAADLFVMPSDFENFGVAIVEAMQAGLPVITTTGTPWKELPTLGAGWCVEPAVEAVRDALGAALAMSDDARQEMGRRAADFASRFRPERAAADLIQVYQWLLGRRDKPDCVC